MARYPSGSVRLALGASLIALVVAGLAGLAFAGGDGRDTQMPDGVAPVCKVVPTGQAVCAGTTVTFTCSTTGAAGNPAYCWQKEPYVGGCLSATSALVLESVAEAATGKYRVVVTDAEGLTDTSYASLTVCEKYVPEITGMLDGPPDCTISTCIVSACEGTQVQLCGPEVPGYTYLWHGPEQDGARTSCILIYTPGTYTLTVTDAAGQQATCSLEAPIHPTPRCGITGGVDSLCGTGTTTWCAPTAPPGYVYTYWWEGPEQYGTTSQCITISTPGTYTVWVTSQYNCQSSCSRTLYVGGGLDCTIQGDEIVCLGQTVTWCGPTGPYTYLWRGPEQDEATTPCITIGTAGTYTLTVSDASGCRSTCEKSLANYSLPDCQIVGAGECCPNSPVTWCAPEVPGWTYLWHGPEKDEATTPCITVSTPGDYSVTVTDANGCQSTCLKGLSASDGPDCYITGDTLICTGGTVEWCGPDVPGYTYLWSGPEQSGATTRCITIGTAGTYALTVTDAAGCQSTCSSTLSFAAAPICNLLEPNPLPECGSGGNNLTTSTTGSISSYSWSLTGSGWSITSGWQSPTVTYTAGSSGSIGQFTLIVSNSDGCKDTCTVAVGCREVQRNCTYSQGGWGSGCPCSQKYDPASTQPGCMRDHFFTTVFPNGVTIGGSPYWAKWTSARAVENFLPAGGTARVLTRNLTNPTSTPAGNLAAQILALRFNREFSCAGVFYQLGLASSIACYGDFVVPNSSACGGKFAGMTVDQFLALANRVVAGNASALTPYGASLSDLNKTATCLNEMFDDCDPYAHCAMPPLADGESPSSLEEDSGTGGTVVMGTPSPGGQGLTELPTAFAVSQIRPNPLNAGTTITYGLPSDGKITIEIYDVRGSRVMTLADEVGQAGYHSVYWDGTNYEGRTAPSGVYFCRARFGDESNITRKMIKLQ
jgi:hypothetical protein